MTTDERLIAWEYRLAGLLPLTPAIPPEWRKQKEVPSAATEGGKEGHAAK